MLMLGGKKLRNENKNLLGLAPPSPKKRGSNSSLKENCRYHIPSPRRLIKNLYSWKVGLESTTANP